TGGACTYGAMEKVRGPRSSDASDRFTATCFGVSVLSALRTSACARMSIRPKPARAQWETRWPTVLADPFLQAPFRRRLPPRLVRGDHFVECNQIPAGGQRGSRTALLCRRGILMAAERFDAIVLGTGQAGKPLALDLGGAGRCSS